MLSQMNKNKKVFINNIINKTKQITFFSGGNFSAQLIMMIYTIIVARALGPLQLGIYSGLYSIFSISITFVNFGLDLWLLSNAHEYKSIRLLIGEVIQGKFLIGMFFAVMSLLVLPKMQPGSFQYQYVFLVFCDVMSEAIQKTFLNVFNIQKKIKELNYLLITSRISKLILLFLLFYLNQVSLLNILLSRTVSTILILMISAIMIKPTFIVIPFRKFIEILRKTAAFGLSEILAMIYGNIDVAMLSLFSVSKTGLYSPANSIIHAMNIIPNSLLQYMLPRYSHQKAKNKEDQKRFLKKTLFGFGFVGLVLSLGLFIFSKLIISIFLGEEFFETINLLRILSPILFFKSLSFGFVLVIILLDMQKKRILPQLIIAIGNILFNLILIPYFGVNAVAWVYLISEILLTLGYGFITIKTLKNKFNLGLYSL